MSDVNTKERLQETDYIDKLTESQDELLQTLKELVQIKSVVEPAKGDMPFGEGVHKAFAYMLNLAEADGFETLNVDNYGGHIVFGGRVYDEEGNFVDFGTETMGILGHLDVVPEGSDWDYDPYGGDLVEGRMYGRGTSDDKGPVLAAYYAMKALRDCGYMPRKKIRLVLGLDEETGWKGMEHYLKHVEPVDFGFTPDGEFPVIHGEMGVMVFELAKKINKTTLKGLTFRHLSGGNAPNMVPDSAKVLMNGESYEHVRELLAEFKTKTGYKLTAKGRGKSLEIAAEGKSAHGANPDRGFNAISALMAFLEEVPFVNEDIRDFIHFYNEHIGFELDGTAMGCGFADELSGKLIFNAGQVKMDDEAARVIVNIRYPLSVTEEQVYESMMPVLEKYDLGLVKLNHMEPIHIPKDDPLITTLMDVYQEYTGDTESQPLVIGGGSYARAMKGTVAYGMLFPGEPDVMHQKNEYVPVDSLMKAAKIYCECMYRLADCVKVPGIGIYNPLAAEEASAEKEEKELQVGDQAELEI